jgi:hypothetical protein
MVTWTSNANINFAKTIKTELPQMDRANNTFFIYIVNVKEWKNTEGNIKIILSYSGNWISTLFVIYKTYE